MTSSRRRLALLGFALFVVTSLASAQGRPPLDRPGRPGGFGHPGGPGGPPPDPAMGLAGRILHDMDLSESQKRQIHEVIRSHVDGELRSLIQDFGEARHALENLVWDPAASDKDVTAASETLARASLALEKARRRLAADVLGALTSTQKQKFHEMLAAARPPMPPPGPPEEDPDSGS